MEILTSKQKDILEFIIDFISKKGFPPSIREAARHFSFASPRSVQKHLNVLEQKGFIKRESKSRGIKVLNQHFCVSLPFLGFIAAGTPIEVIEQQESVEVPSALVGRKPCFVLKVKGNSMVEDHILNGDLIVVEKCQTADDGDVVVALINNESATLKRFYREKNCVRLEPANSNMKPILVKDVAVQGKVRGLFRKF